MKVGMVFECGRFGADGKVYPYLARRIRPELDIQPFFLDSKNRLIQECGSASAHLFNIDKCEKVLLIWDLRPSWEKKGNVCPIEDCHRMCLSLENNLTVQQRKSIRLLCVIQELETLLLIDEKALSKYLYSLVGRECPVKHISHPERNPKPKDKLRQIFRVEHKCRPYEDLKDAEKIIQLVELAKLDGNPSYQKFKQRIESL